MTHLTPRLLAITPATRRKVAPGIEGNDDDLDELADDEGSRVSLTKIMTLPFPQETCILSKYMSCRRYCYLLLPEYFRLCRQRLGHPPGAK